MSSADDKIQAATALSLLLGGICVFGWQAYQYLRFNEWVPLSIISALEWMNIRWAVYPVDWIGLHGILKAIPLSITMLVVGWMVLMSEQS